MTRSPDGDSYPRRRSTPTAKPDRGRSGRRRRPRSPAGQAAPRAEMRPTVAGASTANAAQAARVRPSRDSRRHPSASGRPAGATTTSDNAIISSTIGHGSESAPNRKPRKRCRGSDAYRQPQQRRDDEQPAWNGHRAPGRTRRSDRADERAPAAPSCAGSRCSRPGSRSRPAGRTRNASRRIGCSSSAARDPIAGDAEALRVLHQIGVAEPDVGDAPEAGAAASCRSGCSCRRGRPASRTGPPP